MNHPPASWRLTSGVLMKRSLLILVILVGSLFTGCSESPSDDYWEEPQEERGQPRNEVGDYLNNGYAHIEEGKYEEAVNDFTQALELDFDNAEALIGRAIANTWAGNYKRAENDFNEAYDLSYEKLMTTDAYLAWGIAITAQYSSYSKLDEADYLFRRVISATPNNPDAYTARALMYLRKAYGDIIEVESSGFWDLGNAISDFEKAIELDPEGIQGRTRRFNFEGDMAFLPNYIEANKRRGAVLITTDLYVAKGFEEYDRVLDVYPEDVEALVGRGIAYMRLQQYDLALLDFGKAIELAPDNAHAYAGRAIAYTTEKQFDLAIANFEEAVKIDEGYANGQYHAAFAGPKLQGDSDPKIPFAPAYIDAYTKRGYANLENREYDLAIDDFSKAITFQPDCSESFSECDVSTAKAGRGVAYTRTGAYQQALDDFTIFDYHGIFFDIRGYPQYYIARAIAYVGTGQWAKASADFFEAEGYYSWVEYMDAQAYLARARVYMETDRLDAAIADLHKVIESDPTEKELQEALDLIEDLRSRLQ